MNPFDRLTALILLKRQGEQLRGKARSHTGKTRQREAKSKEELRSPPSAPTAKELIRVGRGRDGGSSGGDKEVVVTLSHRTAVRGTEAPTKCYFGAKRSHLALGFSRGGLIFRTLIYFW